MSEVVRILLLSAHLLAVNVAAGGPIICLWLEWRRDAAGRDALRYLAGWAIVGLLTGGLLGLLLGWLQWDGAYETLWSVHLGRKVYWAVWELVFSIVLMTLYWLWKKQPNSGAGVTVARSLLLAIAVSNLVYHFPPLFFIGQQLLDHNWAGEPLTSGDFRRLMYTGHTLSLTLHFAVASVAVAGVLLLGLSLRRSREEGGAAVAPQIALWGARWSLGATLLQLPIGLWTLVALPRTMQNSLLGQNPLGLIVFGLAMVTALWLTRELVSVSSGETQRGLLLRVMLLMVATILLMTATHEIARGKRAKAAAPPPATTSMSPNRECLHANRYASR